MRSPEICHFYFDGECDRQYAGSAALMAWGENPDTVVKLDDLRKYRDMRDTIPSLAKQKDDGLICTARENLITPGQPSGEPIPLTGIPQRQTTCSGYKPKSIGLF